MRFITPDQNEHFTNILEVLNQLQSPINIILIDAKTAKINENLHKQSVIKAVKSLKPWGRNKEILVDEEKLSGEEISTKFFFGPYFNWETNKLIITKLNPLDDGGFIEKHYYSDDLLQEIEIDKEKESKYNQYSAGFVDCLLNPVYGLNTTINDPAQVVFDINKNLFGDLKKLKIYQWKTDAVNFFDRKALTNYLWSVYSPTYQWIVIIAVSDSD